MCVKPDLYGHWNPACSVGTFQHWSISFPGLIHRALWIIIVSHKNSSLKEKKKRKGLKSGWDYPQLLCWIWDQDTQHHPAPRMLQVSMSQHTAAVSEVGKKGPKWMIYPSYNSTSSCLPRWASVVSLPGHLKSVGFFCVCDGHQDLKHLPDQLLQCNEPQSCALPGVHLLFAFLYFPPITFMLVAPLSTWTTIGHGWWRGWLCPVSHAPKMLSQAS